VKTVNGANYSVAQVSGTANYQGYQ